MQLSEEKGFEFLDLKGLDGHERDRLKSLSKGFNFSDSSEAGVKKGRKRPGKPATEPPRGILMLRRADGQGQARPKSNQWTKGALSHVLAQNGHQIPHSGRLAAPQAAPAQARLAAPQDAPTWARLAAPQAAPAQARLAAPQAAPAQAADRLSQVRSAVRGVLLSLEGRSVLPPRPKGIKNVAVSCYFNSLIQSILVIEGFASFLDGVLEALNRLPFDGVAVLQDIAPVCASLIRLWIDYKAHPNHIGTVRGEHVMQLIRSLDNKEFALDRQSDPLDLFMVLISNIQVELEGVKQGRVLHPKTLLQEEKNINKSCPLQRSFKGLIGGLRYVHGRTVKGGIVPMYSLALPINTPEVTNVKQVLQKHFEVTVCEETRRREKHCFVELPETLMLSFGNTIVDHNGQMKKINKQIDLNQELVLSEDMLSDSLNRQLKKDHKVVKYQLLSGFYHRGQCIDGGHYVAFQRNRFMGWTLLDDGNVFVYPSAEQLCATS